MKVLPVLIVVWSANHFLSNRELFFLSTLLLAISYFFTPGIAGGCLWYNQSKMLLIFFCDIGGIRHVSLL